MASLCARSLLSGAPCHHFHRSAVEWQHPTHPPWGISKDPERSHRGPTKHEPLQGFKYIPWAAGTHPTTRRGFSEAVGLPVMDAIRANFLGTQIFGANGRQVSRWQPPPSRLSSVLGPQRGFRPHKTGRFSLSRLCSTSHVIEQPESCHDSSKKKCPFPEARQPAWVCLTPDELAGQPNPGSHQHLFLLTKDLSKWAQNTPTHEASESAPLQIASKAIPPVQSRAAPDTGMSPGAPWDPTPRELGGAWTLPLVLWAFEGGLQAGGSKGEQEGCSESLWTGTEVWRGTGQDGEFQLS